MCSHFEFVTPDDAAWEEYDQLASRSYGHKVGDIGALTQYSDKRVALRGGRVVAGGLGLLVDQYFGGSPVPSACLGAGCVAPEERGKRLGASMVEDRVQSLREKGAVIASVWTLSNGYARHMGWEAPAQVFEWAVATDELKRAFSGEPYQIQHGWADEAELLHRAVASMWNGPVDRPGWWNSVP